MVGNSNATGNGGNVYLNEGILCDENSEECVLQKVVLQEDADASKLRIIAKDSTSDYSSYLSVVFDYSGSLAPLAIGTPERSTQAATKSYVDKLNFASNSGSHTVIKIKGDGRNRPLGTFIVSHNNSIYLLVLLNTGTYNTLLLGNNNETHTLQVEFDTNGDAILTFDDSGSTWVRRISSTTDDIILST